jgi:hypothetical protein
VEWAIQSARLVLEFVELKAGTRTRDESMADNVDWIAKHNPSAGKALTVTTSELIDCI